jgi:hypothetical protein
MGMSELLVIAKPTYHGMDICRKCILVIFLTDDVAILKQPETQKKTSLRKERNERSSVTYRTQCLQPLN